MTVTSPPRSTASLDEPQPLPEPSRGKTILATVLALVAVWALTLTCHAIGVDWLLLPVMLVSVAAVLRSGTALLDRLVFAGVLLGGGLIVAAIGFTFWPWGLHPVAVGGSALTVVVLVAAAAGRRPQLPLRLGRGDLLVILSGLCLAAAMAWPYRGRGIAQAIAMQSGSDTARHFAMMDAIQSIGGYVFLRQDLARDMIQDVHLTYPQAWHLLGAIIDNFVRSTSVPTDTLHGLTRFFAYDVATYVLLGFIVCWALRRVAGHLPDVSSLLAPMALTLGVLFFGSMLAVWSLGFVTQILGMTLLAVLIAITARPLRNMVEQILLITALCVGMTFTYYFLLPVAAAAVLVWAWTHRRRLRAVWPLALSMAVLVAAVVLTMRAVDAGNSQLSFLWTAFGTARLDPPMVFALSAIALAGLVAVPRGGWRTLPSRVLAAAILASGAMTAALGALQIVKIGRTVYFFDKSMSVYVMVLLISLGLWCAILGRALGWRRDRIGRARRFGFAALMSVALIVSFDVVRMPGAPNRTLGPGRIYLSGTNTLSGTMRTAVRVFKKVPDPERRPTVIFKNGINNSRAILYLSVLQRDYGLTWPEHVWIGRAKTPEDFVAHIEERSTQPFTVVTDVPEVLSRLQSLAAQRPELELEVIDLSTLQKSDARGRRDRRRSGRSVRP